MPLRHDPECGVGVCVLVVSWSCEVLLCVQLSEVESNHRRRHIRSLCFRYNTGQSGRRSRTRSFVLPRHARRRSSSSRFHFSLVAMTRVGIEPDLFSLKGRQPHQIVERAVMSVRTLSAVGREALESSSAAFQATAKPSQLPTHDSLLG